MGLSFDDARFYKVLLRSGFKEDVDKWIENFINNNTPLEGIYLDLACCYSNLNEAISCLHNYVGENPINDKEVCTRLRKFIKEKLKNNEITIEQATNALIIFGSDRIYHEFWSDFFMVGIFEDYVMRGFLDKEKFLDMVRNFINTGERLDSDKFWKSRDKEQKKENKYKLLSALVLFLYSLFVIGLSLFFIWLEKHLTGLLSDKTMGIHIAVVCLLIVPPVVICVTGWDMVYSFLTRGNKNKRKAIKEEKEKHINKLKQDSNNLRAEFNLPDNILTYYEYSLISKEMFLLKWKWILLAICEFLCLAATIGSVFYFDLVTPEVGVAIMMLGVSIGIYGFCILCGAVIKGIVYSILPVLCYAIPLVIVYYIIKVETGWIVGLSTIVFGSVLFILFMYLVVVRPVKKKNAASIKYWNLLEEKYPSIHHHTDYLRAKNYISFWKKDGTNVIIFEYKKERYSIVLTGKILFEGVRLDNVILEYIESKDTFENCVHKGLEILKGNNM